MRIDSVNNQNSNPNIFTDMAKDKQNQAIGDAKKIGNHDENETPKPSDSSADLRDEYIKNEGEPQPSADLYSLGRDENGEPNIVYEHSNSAEKSDTGNKNESKISITNTDKVDAEIDKLKTEKQKIEQQLKSTHDEKKQKELETRLSAIRAELKIKDTDAYRKQHATYTNK